MSYLNPSCLESVSEWAIQLIQSNRLIAPRSMILDRLGEPTSDKFKKLVEAATQSESAFLSALDSAVGGLDADDRNAIHAQWSTLSAKARGCVAAPEAAPEGWHAPLKLPEEEGWHAPLALPEEEKPPEDKPKSSLGLLFLLAVGTWLIVRK